MKQIVVCNNCNNGKVTAVVSCSMCEGLPNCWTCNGKTQVVKQLPCGVCKGIGVLVLNI